MKHKWASLVTMQQEIYYRKYQSFYPSDLFTLDHINMRHPVFHFSEKYEFIFCPDIEETGQPFLLCFDMILVCTILVK